MVCPTPGSMNSCLPKCICRGNEDCPDAFYCDRPCGEGFFWNTNQCDCIPLQGKIQVNHRQALANAELVNCGTGAVTSPSSSTGVVFTSTITVYRYLGIEHDTAQREGRCGTGTDDHYGVCPTGVRYLDVNGVEQFHCFTNLKQAGITYGANSQFYNSGFSCENALVDSVFFQPNSQGEFIDLGYSFQTICTPGAPE